jgi:uncharacterized membrane protein
MTIVGYITDSAGVDTPVTWADANPLTPPIALNLNGAIGGYARGINSLGRIVGYIYDSAALRKPVTWADANPLTVPTALNINVNGAIGGYANGINSLGRIVGSIYNSANVATPVTWADALPNTVPTAWNYNLNGAIEGYAIGINSLGRIVGFIYDSNGVYTPVTWADAKPDTVPITLNLNLNGVIGVIGGFAYGINSLGRIVGSILDSNGVAIPVSWADALPNTVPTALNFNGAIEGYANGINSLGRIVGSIRDNAFVNTPVTWADAFPNTVPTALNFNLNGAIDGYAYGINDPSTPTPTPTPTPLPMSNICFPAGTPIKTDQGIVNIELLDTHTHTINKQTILHITRTVTLDKYLISFERHALSRNCPSQKTIMTKDHQIEFEGRLVPAYRFLDYSDQVKKVQYNGETLYNVLLAQHGTMVVNNLVCETLHPDNIIAKLYTNNYTVAEKHDIISQLNTSLVERDLQGYKKIIQTLHTF